MTSGLDQILDQLQQQRAIKSGPLILEFDFEEELTEFLPNDPLGRIMNRNRSTVRSVVDALRLAAEDDKVVGLIAHIGHGPAGLARTQELRDAVVAFRASGKPCIAWSEAYGEVGPATVTYYFASAFGEVFVQPQSNVGFTGVTVEAPFLKGVFDNVGIEPRFGQRHEYKSMADTYQRTSMSDAHREVAASMAASVADQVVDGVAASRDLDPEVVRSLFDQGPFNSDRALGAGLVDRIGYRDEAYARVRELCDSNGKRGKKDGTKAVLLFASKYVRTARKEESEATNPKGVKAVVKAIGQLTGAVEPDRSIALIHTVGGIRVGSNGADPMSGQAVGSTPVSAAFAAAAKDDDIAAIVFRIDSPGGSPTASDTIRRAMTTAQAAGKPIIASMANVAGSGGYYIALEADKIVAQPGTITGSIGVVAGKMVAAELLGKIGLNFDGEAIGSQARMFQARRDFTDSEWKLLNGMLDEIYEDFISKVGAARGMSRDEVHNIARGRVWTGKQAIEIGLVDELGGLDRAIELAKEAAGLPIDEKIPVMPYPHLSPLDAIRPGGPDNSEDPAFAAAVPLVQALLRPAAQAVAQTGLLPPTGIMAMQERWKIR